MTKSPSKKKAPKKAPVSVPRHSYIVRSTDEYIEEFWPDIFDTEEQAQKSAEEDGSDEFEYTIFKVVAVSEARDPPRKRIWRKI